MYTPVQYIVYTYTQLIICSHYPNKFKHTHECINTPIVLICTLHESNCFIHNKNKYFLLINYILTICFLAPYLKKIVELFHLENVSNLTHEFL